MTSQLLARPARGAAPADVLRAIAGSQSQEPRAGRLQVRARSRGMTAESVERARTEERSIVRHWLMRGTVHLVPTEDLLWMEPLYAERTQTWCLRRLERLGVSDARRDRALGAVRKELERKGRLKRSEMMEVVEKAGLEMRPELRIHFVLISVLSGIACVGPDEGGGNTLVDRREWIGEPAPADPEKSMTELARRYFAAFAPTGERDFAYWAGLPLGDCRAAIGRIANELQRLSGPGGALLAPKDFPVRAPRSPIVRLLGAFDTYLMGYKSRRPAVDEAGERVVLPGGGVLRPTICVDGQFVGTWRSKRSGKRLVVELEPFDRIEDAWRPALESEAADVARFDGAREWIVT